MSPDALCPTCRRWTPAHDWQPVPPDAFPFTIRCSRCGAHADVADLGYPLTVTPPRPPPPAGQGP